MTTRLVLLAGLLLVPLAFAATDDPEPPYKPKLYSTPQAAFEAFVAAMSKRDFRVMIDTLTPGAQKEMVVDFAFQGLRYRNLAEGRTKDNTGGKDEKLAEQYKALFDVMEKHGLGVKAKGIDLNTDENKSIREAVLKLVKKPDAFVVDYSKAIDKVHPDRVKRREGMKSQLIEVTIKGNKATASVVPNQAQLDKDKAPDRRAPVEFEKIDGGWRINPSPRRIEDAPKAKK